MRVAGVGCVMLGLKSPALIRFITLRRVVATTTRSRSRLAWQHRSDHQSLRPLVRTGESGPQTFRAGDAL